MHDLVSEVTWLNKSHYLFTPPLLVVLKGFQRKNVYETIIYIQKYDEESGWDMHCLF